MICGGGEGEEEQEDEVRLSKTVELSRRSALNKSEKIAGFEDRRASAWLYIYLISGDEGVKGRNTRGNGGEIAVDDEEPGEREHLVLSLRGRLPRTRRFASLTFWCPKQG